MLVFRRGIATRSKKVTVQLLKDWPGVGYKGQVVSVSDGMMRNRLHPHNGAAYVLKGEPLRIPLYSEEAARARQRAEQETIAKASLDKSTPKESQEAARSSETKVKSVLNFLEFPTAQAAKKSEFSAQASVESPVKAAAEPALEKPAKPASAQSQPAAQPKASWENDIISEITKDRLNQ